MWATWRGEARSAPGVRERERERRREEEEGGERGSEEGVWVVMMCLLTVPGVPEKEKYTSGCWLSAMRLKASRSSEE